MGVNILLIIYQVTPLESSEDAAVLHSSIVKEDTPSSIPAHVENLSSLTPDTGSGDGAASQPFIETESFSDSYTHITPSPVPTSLPGDSEEEEELSQGEEKGKLRKTPTKGEKYITHQKRPSFADALHSKHRTVTF